jgi:hypothetical protein
MLDRGFLLFDIFVNQTRYASAREATWRLILGLAFGVAHEPPVKRFLSADVIIIVESELAALATLKIFCHRFLPLRSGSSGSLFPYLGSRLAALTPGA